MKLRDSMIVGTFAVLAVSSPARATDVQMPHIAPSNCKTSAVIPEGAAGVLFSKNCEYAFVMPPSRGRASVTNFIPSTNLQKCSVLKMDD